MIRNAWQLLWVRLNLKGIYTLCTQILQKSIFNDSSHAQANIHHLHVDFLYKRPGLHKSYNVSRPDIPVE